MPADREPEERRCVVMIMVMMMRVCCLLLLEMRMEQCLRQAKGSREMLLVVADWLVGCFAGEFVWWLLGVVVLVVVGV